MQVSTTCYVKELKGLQGAAVTSYAVAYSAYKEVLEQSMLVFHVA